MRRRSHGPRLVEWTGERCVPWVPQVAVLYEHLHRYMWAREHAVGRDVLDLGSGEGFGAAILGEAARSVHGIDVDPRAVEHSRLNYGTPEISFSADDARTLDGLSDESFDLVVAFEVLEHVVEHDQVLDAIERVLRPGGTLIISTPNREAYAQARGDEQNPFHLHELSEQEFAELLSSRFTSVALFAQRSQSGSVIEAIDDGASGTGGHATHRVRHLSAGWEEIGPPEPLYLIGVASAEALVVRDSSALVDYELPHVIEAQIEAAARDRLRDEELQRERARIDATGSEASFAPPGHFYSPIPSAEEIEHHRGFDWSREELPGIDLRAEAQLALLERFAEGYAELPFEAEPRPGARYHYENPNYAYSDAIFLGLMIRELRPRRFIEVGSGDSSCALLDAADAFLGGELDVTFVEPYADYLRSLLKPDEVERIRLLERGLQEVDLAEFERLEGGDILFIDSTHVAKLGSDVNHLVFEILPRLAPGVHVHLHDIFWPFEYPHEWLAEGRFWNEQYLLHAFLQFSSAYEIVLFGHWAVTRHSDWFAEHMPLCLRNPGGSLWLRRAA